MSVFRLIILSMIALCLPSLLAIYLSPYVFQEAGISGPPTTYEFTPSQETLRPVPPVQSPDQHDPAAVFGALLSDKFLDPTLGQAFVVSVLLRVAELPKVGTREKFIYKYEANTPPYPGWALAVHRMSTSFRPEVYWRDIEGKGGWYSFDELTLREGMWYRFTLFSQPGEFLSLYVDELGADGEPSDDDETAKNHALFLGGFDVSEVGAPVSDGGLHLRARSTRNRSYQLDLSEVVITNAPSKNLSPDVVNTLASSEAFELVDHFGRPNLALWIDPSGADRSPHKRSLDTAPPS